MVSVRVSGMISIGRTTEDAAIVLPPVRSRDAMEEEMVEAVAISWRLPGAAPGSSPWASDGPWDQMLRDAWDGDYDARGGFMVEAPEPRSPITREDMARVERAAKWLALLHGRPTRRGQTSEASDGAIVAAVLRQKAAGRSQVDWAQVLRAVRLDRGKAALKERYARAMDWLAQAVGAGR